MAKKEKKEEKIELMNNIEIDLDDDDDDERIAIGGDSVKDSSTVILTLDKEELESSRVKYAREMGNLMDKGIEEYGGLWAIGLIQCGLQNRIDKHNKKNEPSFFRRWFGL